MAYPYTYTGTGTTTNYYDYNSSMVNPYNQAPIKNPTAYNYPSTNQIYPSVNVVWIPDEREVDSYPVGPNSAVALWDYSNGKIFLKQADASGRPTIKKYLVTEEVDKAASKETETYSKKIDELMDVISSLKKDVDNLQKDMYGLAGGKKQSHKREEE